MEGECSEGEGWLLVRVHVPELNVQKSLQFSRDQLVWDVKQQCLAALPKEEKLSQYLQFDAKLSLLAVFLVSAAFEHQKLSPVQQRCVRSSAMN
ncbi:unnamed protein product [Leptidea sinapis]|uniref:Talin N-terminal F0 domain-containing protein n=1 Tax=Leptidea sinapis TaxID=189913 RepID=A0A5E4PMW3_9NEOP|nr:unnamed protein product [Leptidea sinapis]